MAVAKPVIAVAWQRVFSSRGSVLTIKPCLIPVFGVAVMFGMRKIDLFPFLNRHSSKFSIRAVRKFSSAV